MVTRTVCVTLAFSLTICTITGCTTANRLTKNEDLWIRSESAGSIDKELLVWQSDGKYRKFASSRIQRKGEKKYLAGTTAGVNQDSAAIIIELPLADIVKLQINECLLVYTRDSKLYEFAPLSWTFHVVNGRIDYLDGVAQRKGYSIIRGTFLEEGKPDEVVVHIDIDQVERFEFSRIEPVGTIFLATISVVTVFAFIEFVVRWRPTLEQQW